jgi:hypothetical protein
MPTMTQILAAMALGVACYLATFAFVLHRPLTNTINGEYLQRKTDRLIATQPSSPRIVILAGSTARFSHRCETLEQDTGVSCTNMSVSGQLNLAWQFDRMKRFLRPGDLLYLPLEYRARQPIAHTIGVEAPYILRFARSELAHYSLRQMLSAAFYFDLRYFFSALGEMALWKAGVSRRYSVATLTPQGDESGHTAAKGIEYWNYIRSLKPLSVDVEAYRDDLVWSDVDDILRWGREHGVLIVGGLPTTFEEVKIPSAMITLLQERYRQGGGCFIALDNLSRYPRSFFYDTQYHLNESAQIAHTRALERQLALLTRSSGKDRCQLEGTKAAGHLHDS